MLRDFFLWALTSFVIEPAMGEMTDRLAQLRVPPAVVQQLQACALEAPPALAAKAANDLWWGASTVIKVAIGLTDAKSVLAEATPGCAAAVGAVRPLLSGQAAWSWRGSLDLTRRG